MLLTPQDQLSRLRALTGHRKQYAGRGAWSPSSGQVRSEKLSVGGLAQRPLLILSRLCSNPSSSGGVHGLSFVGIRAGIGGVIGGKLATQLS